MKNIKKYILGMATALCLCQSCDVLDIDPTEITVKLPLLILSKI